jgi:hypothetical protein
MQNSRKVIGEVGVVVTCGRSVSEYEYESEDRQLG